MVFFEVIPKIYSIIHIKNKLIKQKLKINLYNLPQILFNSKSCSDAVESHKYVAILGSNNFLYLCGEDSSK